MFSPNHNEYYLPGLLGTSHKLCVFKVILDALHVIDISSRSNVELQNFAIGICYCFE